MPAVDHLSNRGALNVLLDRTMAGVSYGIPSTHPIIGLFMNFVRLTDKALREYDAARAEVISYLQPANGLRTSAYLRAIDHMENCVSATHRAVLNAKALRSHRVGRSAYALRLANTSMVIGNHADLQAGGTAGIFSQRRGALRREASGTEEQDHPSFRPHRAAAQLRRRPGSQSRNRTATAGRATTSLPSSRSRAALRPQEVAKQRSVAASNC